MTPTKLTAFSLSLLSLLAALGFWAVGLKHLHTTLAAPTWPRVKADSMAMYIERRPIMTRTRHITHYAVWARYTFNANGQAVSTESDHLLRVFLHQAKAEALQQRLAQGLTIRFNPRQPRQNLPQQEIYWWAQRQIEFFFVGLVFFLGSLALFSAHSGKTSKPAFIESLNALGLKWRHALILFFLLALGAGVLHNWEMMFFAAAYLGLAWLGTQRFWPARLTTLICLGLYAALGLQAFL